MNLGSLYNQYLLQMNMTGSKYCFKIYKISIGIISLTLLSLDSSLASNNNINVATPNLNTEESFLFERKFRKKAPLIRKNKKISVDNIKQFENKRIAFIELKILGDDKSSYLELMNNIKSKKGDLFTLEKAQKDLNNIYSIGKYKSIEIIPEYSDLGLLLTYEVQPNPMLRSVTSNSVILKQKYLDSLFKKYYGKQLNINDLEKTKTEIRSWLLDNGYSAAQFINGQDISPHGVVTLKLSDGIISNIKYTTLTKKRLTDNVHRYLDRYVSAPAIQKFEQIIDKPFNMREVQELIRASKDESTIRDVTVEVTDGPKVHLLALHVRIFEKNKLDKINDELQELQKQKQYNLDPDGDTERHLEINNRILEISKEKKDKNLEASTLYDLSNNYYHSGNFIKSLEKLTQSLEVVSDLGEEESKFLKITILINFCNVYRNLGEYQKSLLYCNMADSNIKSILQAVQNSDEQDNINIKFLKLKSLVSRQKIYVDLNETIVSNRLQVKLVRLTQNLATIIQETEDDDEETSELELNIQKQALNLALLSVLKPSEKFSTYKYLNLVTEQVRSEFSDSSTDEPIEFTRIKSVLYRNINTLSLLMLANEYLKDSKYSDIDQLFNRIERNLRSVDIADIEAEDSRQTERLNRLKENLALFVNRMAWFSNYQKANYYLKQGIYRKSVRVYNRLLASDIVLLEPELLGQIYVNLGDAYSQLKQYTLSFDSYSKANTFWDKSNKPWKSADVYYRLAKLEKKNLSFLSAISFIEKSIAVFKKYDNNNLHNSSKDIIIAPTLSKDASFTTNLSPLSKSYELYIDLLYELGLKRSNPTYEKLAFLAFEESRNSNFRYYYRNRDRFSSLSSSGIQQANSLSNGISEKNLLQDIQNDLLGENSALFEYALGDERSYLWVVTKDSFVLHVLPSRDVIRELSLQYYTYISDPGLRDRKISYSAINKKLSQLLFKPFTSTLDFNRIYIVSDELLQFIPFSSLQAPSELNNSPILLKHEIISIPSASSAVSRINRNGLDDPTFRSISVLSDPVYGVLDKRISDSYTAQNAITKLPFFDRTVLSTQQLYARLPSTQVEAGFIKDSANSRTFTNISGLSASFSTLQKSSFLNSDIVHFSTHGILDSSYPERSGLLISLLNDNFNIEKSLLSTSDVFGLDMSNKLVVLSGCNTALGNEAGGESAIGLTSAFLFSGAHSVISSLWSVDDKATALFMNSFYKNLFDDKLSIAKSFRNAQLEVLNTPGYESPYYWASFIINR